jgi:hypothetical protein
MRPIAEFLGTIALIIGAISVSLLVGFMYMMWIHFRAKSKQLKEHFKRGL